MLGPMDRNLPQWKQRGERAPRRGGTARRFEPERYGEALCALLRDVDAHCQAHPDQPLEQPVLHRMLRKHPRGGDGLFSRSQLVQGLRHFGPQLALTTPVETLIERLKLRPIRSLSGVSPVTVFTRPFPCPGKCVFCPNDVRMPKSYLADEPAAQRAEDNAFDPYLQTYNRLAAYHALGHACDKVELLILGGTWSFYPEPYQVWFVTRCLQALNDFEGDPTPRTQRPEALDFTQLPRQLDGRDLAGSYNQRVTRFLHDQLEGQLTDERERSVAWEQLLAAQRDNERAGARCVGLVVETRPDHVDGAEVHRLRRLGVTKVQVGLQSLSDEILERNQRGHTLAQARRALALLRGAGFKLHAHWMANLLGATPEDDQRDFSRLFDDPNFRPDELKVYPCALVPSAELMQHYEAGNYQPYERADLLGVVEHALAYTPRYCRLTRVIRDISSDDILVGNKQTNLREVAQAGLERRGVRGMDIRAREIRGQDVQPSSLNMVATEYSTSIGQDVFIELCDGDDRIAGFARLCLPTTEAPLQELQGNALLREVHVYGAALSLGERRGQRAQHQGLGTRLVEEAARRASDAGYGTLSVISAIGTRDYYRRLGFVDGELYQHRTLAQT